MNFLNLYYKNFESNFAEQFKTKVQTVLDPLDYIFRDAIWDCFYEI